MIALLANPGSGSGEAEAVERMLARAGREVVRFRLERSAEAAESGAERIVVAGGDGSIGCGAEAAARAGVPLAVVPVGTANDFARALGIPADTAAAAELAATGSRTLDLDLGRAGGRPFVNAASAGLSPVAARNARGLKHALGPPAYAIGALRAALRAQPVECRVTADGSTLFRGRAWQVTVGVTGAFGGGAEVEADPADGMLDVVAIEAGSRARLALHGYGLRAGRVEGQTGVVTGAGREVAVDTDGTSGFNVDGELVEVGALRFAIEPHAFAVVVGR